MIRANLVPSGDTVRVVGMATKLLDESVVSVAINASEVLLTLTLGLITTIC